MLGKMRVLYLLIEGIVFILFFPFSGSTQISSLNPWNFRNDFYKMPIYEISQKKALLQKRINWLLPKVALNYPAEVTDSEGNQSVYNDKKRKVSVSSDGIIFFVINGVNVHSKKKKGNSDYHLYRTYKREFLHNKGLKDKYGERIIYKTYSKNEFGETVSEETYGLFNRLLERKDAFKRTLQIFEYDQKNYSYTHHSGMWEYDNVNRIWKRYGRKKGRLLPVVERRKERGGYIVAHWEEGEFFGKKGLWRIEKGWDGEKIVDMFYTLYDDFANKPQEEWHKKDYLVKEFIRQGGTTINKESTKFTYRKLRYLDPVEEGEIWDGKYAKRWNFEYKGLKLLRATQDYSDQTFYEARIYDLAGNIDKIVRVDKNTGETIATLEDRIYFSEVKDKTSQQLLNLLDTQQKIAESLYQWIKEMKIKGKGEASLFGIWNLRKQTITLYNEDNLPYVELFLQPDWEY